jgi:glycosyltransferase involved in cell wall biosynthesis
MEFREETGVQREEDRPRVVAVIPAYNEERCIGSVVLQARAHVDTVVVVDDGSTDATAQIAEAGGAIVVRHQRNRGKGAALNSGLQRARSLCPEAVVLLDADGQHLPHEVPAVVAPVLAGQADIVVGSRYLVNGNRQGRDKGQGRPKGHGNGNGVPRHRAVGHWAFTKLTNAASGVQVSDSQSGFRALSGRAVQAVNFSSDGFSVESEMQFLARELGLRVVEVPISADYAGKPKRPVLTHGVLVLNGILRLVGQYRPLLFFGLGGLFLLLFGLGWGAWVVHIYRTYQQLAVGYALIAVLLTILGSLGLFAGIILHSVRGLLLDLTGSVKGEGRGL